MARRLRLHSLLLLLILLLLRLLQPLTSTLTGLRPGLGLELAASTRKTVSTMPEPFWIRREARVRDEVDRGFGEDGGVEEDGGFKSTGG